MINETLKWVSLCSQCVLVFLDLTDSQLVQLV